MTKNRKAKQAARAVQAATGGKYTDARRHSPNPLSSVRCYSCGHGYDANINLIDTACPACGSKDFIRIRPEGAVFGQPRSGKSPSLGDPYAIPYGETADGDPVIVRLGGPDLPPLSWVAGGAGSGKTWFVQHAAALFLARNPRGRVVFIDEFCDPMLDRSHPNPMTGGIVASHRDWIKQVVTEAAGPEALARVQITHPGDVDGFSDLFAEAFNEPGVPWLFVVDHAYVPSDRPLDDPERVGEEALWRWVEQAARMGRSTQTRLLISAQRAPMASMVSSLVRSAIGTRVLFEPSSRAMQYVMFGDHAADITGAEFRDRTSRGWAWMAHSDGPPERVRFS